MMSHVGKHSLVSALVGLGTQFPSSVSPTQNSPFEPEGRYPLTVACAQHVLDDLLRTRTPTPGLVGHGLCLIRRHPQIDELPDHQTRDSHADCRPGSGPVALVAGRWRLARVREQLSKHALRWRHGREQPECGELVASAHERLRIAGHRLRQDHLVKSAHVQESIHGHAILLGRERLEEGPRREIDRCARAQLGQREAARPARRALGAVPEHGQAREEAEVIDQRVRVGNRHQAPDLTRESLPYRLSEESSKAADAITGDSRVASRRPVRSQTPGLRAASHD
jgi:hypothetical protein